MEDTRAAVTTEQLACTIARLAFRVPLLELPHALQRLLQLRAARLPALRFVIILLDNNGFLGRRASEIYVHFMFFFIIPII